MAGMSFPLGSLQGDPGDAVVGGAGAGADGAAGGDHSTFEADTKTTKACYDPDPPKCPHVSHALSAS